MNTAVQSPPAQTAIKPNQMLVQGRIESFDEFDDHYYTIVVTPAPDAYSQPSTLKVRSTRKIGRQGEDIRQPCTWNGWLKKGDKGASFLNGFFIALE